MRRRGGAFGLRAGIANVLDLIKESYWFWPLAMCLVAAVIAVVATSVEGLRGFDVMERLGLAAPLEPDSARAMLSTIASSMLGVAGVSFSILIAAFAFASQQFGPRILTNFMRDRANQVALGTFASTFLYCLIVLRITGQESVPNLAVTIGLVAAVASLVTLLFFFHHAPESIRLTRIVSNVGSDLLAEIDRILPEDADAPPPGDDGEAAREALALKSQAEARPVRCHANGYVRFVDYGSLMQIACEEDLVVRLDRRPGDFSVSGRPLAWAWPAARIDDELEHEMRACIKLGPSRTPTQDAEFLFELLMDVASRALSPGINDPRTAMVCLDWIAAALARATRGTPRPTLMRDENGTVRLIQRAHRFEDLADHAVGRLRPYFQTDPAAALHMMARIGGLVLDARHPSHREALMRHARDLADGAREELPLECDRARVEERLAFVEEVARGGLSNFEARARHPWL